MTYFAAVLPVELERLFSSSAFAIGKMPTCWTSAGRATWLEEPEPRSKRATFTPPLGSAKHATFMPLFGSAITKTFDKEMPC